jgi:hypothetical protein
MKKIAQDYLNDILSDTTEISQEKRVIREYTNDKAEIFLTIFLDSSMDINYGELYIKDKTIILDQAEADEAETQVDDRIGELF